LILADPRPALGWIDRRGQNLCRLAFQTHLGERHGAADSQSRRHDQSGIYGSDIEFDAQGEFIGIAGDIYRISRDRAFLNTIFEPVVRAAKFIEELCARTNALHSLESQFHGLLALSIGHEGYSKPSFSYWDNFFALSACGTANIWSQRLVMRTLRPIRKARARSLPRTWPAPSASPAKSWVQVLFMARLVVRTSIPHRPPSEDVLPAEFIPATYDLFAGHLKLIGAPNFEGSYTLYVNHDLNAFVSLGRFRDGCSRLRSRAEDPPAGGIGPRLSGARRSAPDYIGNMPHTWIGAIPLNFSGLSLMLGGRAGASPCMSCQPPSAPPISGCNAAGPARRLS
jgi:hypothetical protein